MNQKVLTVSDLNDHVKFLMDNDSVLMHICVRGELSNYKIHSSGHHYFTLKDENSAVRCVMFRSSAAKLKFRPDSGMAVLAVGHVSVFPRDGSYQLYCTALSPDGVGDLHVAYEQLKEKLGAEGLFDPIHKRPLPVFPDTIAVITAATGAAVRDMIRILGKRWPMATVVVMPVLVQGAGAPEQIAGAIQYANVHQFADVIITGRGGGSMEDLWAFNDERVARAIAASKIPVISAVGHEPDVTIADFVADRRAATPSNAAEIAVPDQNEVRAALSALEIRMGQAMQKQLILRRNRLQELSERRVLQSPAAYVDRKRMELDYVQNQLVAAAERVLSEKQRQFVGLTASLDALSPLKVLQRGYAVAMSEKRTIVKTVRQIAPGSLIDLKLLDGTATCRVETIRTAEEPIDAREEKL